MEFLHFTLQAIFFCCCGYHCYTDFKEQLLYDEVSLVMLISGMLEGIILNKCSEVFWGGLAIGGVLLLLYIASRGGMGLGDVKLGVVLGTWLGWQQGLLSILFALCLGSIVGVLLIAIRVKTRKDAIPFGPFMCLSGIIMLYYGSELLAWYCKTFNY